MRAVRRHSLVQHARRRDTLPLIAPNKRSPRLRRLLSRQNWLQFPASLLAIGVLQTLLQLESQANSAKVRNHWRRARKDLLKVYTLRFGTYPEQLNVFALNLENIIYADWLHQFRMTARTLHHTHPVLERNLGLR